MRDNGVRIDELVESTWVKLIARLIAPPLVIAVLTGVATGVSRIYASITATEQAIALLTAEVKYNRERADQAIEREARDLAALEQQLGNQELRIQGLEHRTPSHGRDGDSDHAWPAAPR
jgi:hypothetical protein